MPLNDYETLEKLGTGTYGEVYLVRSKVDGKKVSLLDLLSYLLPIDIFLTICFLI